MRLLDILNKNVEKIDKIFSSYDKKNNIEANGVIGASWKILVHDALTKLNKYE